MAGCTSKNQKLPATLEREAVAGRRRLLLLSSAVAEREVIASPMLKVQDQPVQVIEERYLSNSLSNLCMSSLSICAVSVPEQCVHAGT